MYCKTNSLSLDAPYSTKQKLAISERYQLQISSCINEVADIWREVLTPASSLFLDPTYLYVLEQNPPRNMRFYYLLFWEESRCVGIAYIQDMPFRPAGYGPDPELKGWKRLRHWIKKRLVMPSLICGNLLLTGQHGFCFPNLEGKQQVQLIEAGLAHIRRRRPSDSRLPPLLVYKDFRHLSKESLAQPLQRKGYLPIQVQPAMRLHLRPHWRQFDDYLADMKSKYRVRARRAAKKGQDFERKELSLEDLQALEERLYELYINIAERADYNGFLLHPQYFTALKRAFPKQVKLFGYFLSGRLVAFYTAVFNKSEVEAHFLGFESELNASHQVYLNILYDLVHLSIYHHKSSLHFARTALAIKSSVGAEPEAMTLFMRQSSTLLNQVLGPTFNWLHDDEEWTQRHPFKRKS